MVRLPATACVLFMLSCDAPGTVVTIHQDNKLDVTKPIRERLRLRDTGLRQTADASLLVQSLIDLSGYIYIADRIRY